MQKQVYFDKDFVAFFNELADHNHKEWFDENRKRYKDVVKDPFDKLVKDLLVEVGQLDPRVTVPYNKCIFRINRDIRFSKDKTPYKTNRSAIISPYGTKNKSFPGMYFEMNAREFRIYGGVYMLDTKQIHRIREDIMDYHQDFKKIIEDTKFKKTFGKLNGEHAKRLPKEFQEFADKEPLMYHKNWYVYRTLPIEQIFKDDLLKVMVDHYKLLQPLSNFFERPLLDPND